MKMGIIFQQILFWVRKHCLEKNLLFCYKQTNNINTTLFFKGLKKRTGMICVHFLANRWKLSTENARKHEQISSLIAGGEESGPKKSQYSVAYLWWPDNS